MENRSDIRKALLSHTANIEEVIVIATKSFVLGHDKSNALKKLARDDAKLREKLSTRHFAAYIDKRFQGDINLIPGTSLVASAGPSRADAVQVLIQDTLFNPHIPIKRILNLCSVTAYHPSTHQDFYDYCLKEREEQFGHYFVNIKRVKGEITSTDSGHQTFPKQIVQSKIGVWDTDKVANPAAVEPAVLEVTTLKLDDGYSIDLTKPGSEELKSVLMDLYQASLKEPLLIHCASGVGRTGHIILMFEILKHHDTIFGQKNPEVSAAAIHRILERMRQVRPALVSTDEQFAYAIRNADLLYHYALAKKAKLGDAPKASGLISASLFASSPVADVFQARGLFSDNKPK